MNILFVSALLPYPLYSGGQVRIYNLLRELSYQNDIYLLSFIRNLDEVNYLKQLSFCKEIHTFFRGRVWQHRYILKSAFGPYPLLYASYDNAKLRFQILNSIKNHHIDVIHIEPSYVWPSLPETTIPIVLSEHNIEYKVYKEFADRNKFVPLKPFMYVDVAKHIYWENKVWDSVNQITTVSESDASEIRKKTKTRVSVVPNGVDLNQFTVKNKWKKIQNPICLFVGNFSWYQNIDAIQYILDSIWPEIIRKVPTAKLKVVGRKIPARIKQALVKNSAIIEENISNITTAYSDSDVLLAPIRTGGGTKYKILEAMASGLPIITTRKGVEGLPVIDTQHVLLAENPTDFCIALKKLIENTELYEIISKRGREFVAQGYTWNLIAKSLQQVWIDAYEKSG